jgi:hypothetical protein
MKLRNASQSDYAQAPVTEYMELKQIWECPAEKLQDFGKYT